MVSDEEFEAKLSAYKRMTNMSSSDLQEWRKSKTYQEYEKRKGGPPASVAIERNLMLQRKIEDGSISKRQYDALKKAVSFLSRMKENYRDNGAGDNKVPGGKTTFLVSSLRSWAYSPYRTYT